MKFIQTLMAVLAFTAASANAIELNVPDATKRPETRPVATTVDTTSSLPSAKLTLPPPPPESPSIAMGSILARASILKDVQLAFQHWQVAAVLDDVAIIRTAEPGTGLQSLTFKNGRQEEFLAGVKLTAEVSDQAVKLTATKDGEEAVVFVGLLQTNFPSAH